MNFHAVDRPNVRIDPMIASVEEVLRSQRMRPADFVVAAPGRVNLIGEHIDYNDGFVLPMAIERYVVMAASLRRDPSRSEASFFSVNLSNAAELTLAEGGQPQDRGWVSYIEGVVAGFLELGIAIPAFDAVFQSNVPLGGGLSSSAALEVATATLLEAITGHNLGSAQKALLCQQAEHRYAGVPCGIMDQFASVFGKADELMLLDCRSQQVESVAFADADITVLITNSNVKHELSGGEYAERRSQCDSALKKLGYASWRDVTMEHLKEARETLSAAECRRAMHVVSEIDRTTDAAAAFRASDWNRVGELMNASHDSLRDNYEVSCNELDVLVDLARGIGDAGGVIGSRMTGGGFGGCTVTLVRSDKVDVVMSSMTTRYEAETGIKPDCFASRPANGAHVIRGGHNS